MMYRPNTTWTWAFMAVTFIQAAAILGIEAYVFAKFQSSLKPLPDNANADQKATAKTIPTYLTLFIFGFVYQLVLVYDSLRLKNTIQVIGLCLYNGGMLIYSSVQIDQISNVTKGGLTGIPYVKPSSEVWDDIRPSLQAVPIIITVFTVLMSFIAWKLYDEFAWTIYKQISADLRMKRRYLTFQIYIALLKFDFFFFLGFTVQFLVIVRIADAELGLTIAAIPITIFILFMAAFWTRRENKFGMLLIMALYICGLGYFVFKLARMYQDSHKALYLPVRKSLTSFAVITIILIILTIINATACILNFDKGLKQHVMKSKSGQNEQEKLDHMTELPELKPGQIPASSRMTIE